MTECAYNLYFNYLGKSSKPTGTLVITWEESTDNPFFTIIPKQLIISFDPLNILGELRNQESRTQYPFGKSQSNISYESYEYEFGFGSQISIEHDKEYIDALNYIDSVISHHKKILTTSLEKKFKINYEMFIPKFRINLSSIKGNVIENFSTNVKCEHDELIYLERNHKMVYHCVSMKDVIISIFHFLLYHNYTISNCHLCGNLFARKNTRGRQILCCDRPSFYNIEPYLTPKLKEEYKSSEKTCQCAFKSFNEQISYNRREINKTSGDVSKKFIDEANYNQLLDKYTTQQELNPCFKNQYNLYLLTCNETKKSVWTQTDKSKHNIHLNKLLTTLEENEIPKNGQISKYPPKEFFTESPSLT